MIEDTHHLFSTYNKICTSINLFQFLTSCPANSLCCVGDTVLWAASFFFNELKTIKINLMPLKPRLAKKKKKKTVNYEVRRTVWTVWNTYQLHGKQATNNIVRLRFSLTAIMAPLSTFHNTLHPTYMYLYHRVWTLYLCGIGWRAPYNINTAGSYCHDSEFWLLDIDVKPEVGWQKTTGRKRNA